MQIKNVPIIDNFNDDHTHLGLLDFDKLPGLKRSCGSFSSCNPCRWMLRSSKCWRIQENILGGDGGGFGRKFGEFNGRVFFVGKLEKSIHMGSKKSNRVQNPTWLLFLFFSTGAFFFSAGDGSYNEPHCISLTICIESGSTMCSCQRNPPNLWCPNYMARGGVRFLVPFHVCSNHPT